MITREIKQSLLKELEKIGNVGSSCLKVGINKATYYRWRKVSKKFRGDSNGAIRIGRENISDIAEQALLLKVKEKHFPAITYALSHNSRHYKPKSRKVTIEHSNADKEKYEHLKKEYDAFVNKVSEDYRLMIEDVRESDE